MKEPDATSGSDPMFPTQDQIESVVRSYRDAIPRYQLLADYLTRLLQHVCRSRSKNAIVQARAKAPASVAAKVVKSWPRYKRHGDLTDLCGARVIAPLLREASSVTSWLREHLYEREYEDMLERLKPESFGYRGEHLLIVIDPRLLPPEMVTDELRESLSSMREYPSPPGTAGARERCARLRARLSGETGPPVIDTPLWRELSGLVAEIQIRTIAQHAWSDVGHDLVYKSPMLLPGTHHRENAKIAAMLEAADQALEGLVDRIEVIQQNSHRYFDEDGARRRIALHDAILSVDPGNAGVACEIIRTQMSLGDLEGATETISRFEPEAREASVALRVLEGRVLVARHAKEPSQRAEFTRGRDLLESLVHEGLGGVEAATALGEAYAIDRAAIDALRAFETAYTIDPADPRALTGYLRLNLAREGGRPYVHLAFPDIQKAMGRCRLQIAARANLPDVLFLLAELQIVAELESGTSHRDPNLRSPGAGHRRGDLRSTYEGLYSACRAVSLTPLKNLEALDEFHRRMGLLEDGAGSEVPGAAWARAVVELAMANRRKSGHAPDRAAADTFDGQGTPRTKGPKAKPLPVGPSGERRPVLIIAGGCDVSDAGDNAEQRRLVHAIAEVFRGVVISGGTTQGISGLVGELFETRSAKAGLDAKEPLVRTIGYCAERLDSARETPDDRYTERRQTKGWSHGFSPLEPLQVWADLHASGIEPEEVRLVGINGGRIARFEYHLAAAMGAQAVVVRDTGREASRLQLEEDEPGNENLLFLPSDVETIKAFVGDVSKSPHIGDHEKTLVREIQKTYGAVVDEQRREDYRIRFVRSSSEATSSRRNTS